MSKAKAEELGLPWLAEIGAHGAWPARTTRCSPSRPTRSRQPGKEGIEPADLDLVEINEAFASVGIQSMRELGWTRTGSTSTAARSRWATRSACPVPGSS